jgi:5'-deoxynucleotidase YfbR-like HD superfamily hydrolase
MLLSLPPRLFSSKNNPNDWMVQAEQEAIAATNARAAKQGTANNQMMNKLQHEMDAEKVHNAIKLEDKLKMLIQKCNEARSGAVDTRGRTLYSALRKKALQTRQDLITQREAAGMLSDAAGIVEAAFPIPAQV